MPDLLLELFSEEIPARMQARAAGDLQKAVTDGLVEAGLTYEGAKSFATPRRLALTVQGLTARSADVSEERKGPRTDAPEKAIAGFLRGAGLASIDEAEVQSDPKKGDFYVARITKSGRDATNIIADLVPRVIGDFSWPKSMRWGERSASKDTPFSGPDAAGPQAMRWVRPLRSILCTFGPETEEPEIVPFEVAGIASGNRTHGHRFMAPDAITVKRFDDYVGALEAANVVLDGERRRAIIETDARTLAGAQGLEVVDDPGLLAEVAGLVEWPVVLMGSFDEAFLDMPDEVIRLTIRAHQKCFVLRDPNTGDLTNKFLLTANIAADDGGTAIIDGNERVIAARLSDARFFWDADRATKLEDWAQKLEKVTFHEKLGTQAERVERIAALARELAPACGADPDLAEAAAKLCKADLPTGMVGEFAELQGVMGRYYALEQGLPGDIANAIRDHYKPQGPADLVPAEPVSIAVALADKLDTLVGFWAIDEKPTGSKDPYALRRAALGVIRIVLENELRVNLDPIARFVFNLVGQVQVHGDIQELPPGFDELPVIKRTQIIETLVIENLLAFFADRLKVHLRDAGTHHDLIDAVFALPGQDDLVLIVRRVEALGSFLATDDGANLLAGYKRAANILRAEEKKNGAGAFDGEPDGHRIEQTGEQAERELFNVLRAVEGHMADHLHDEDFAAAMGSLAELRPAVDAFFDDVTVNADDPDTRINRLRLLNRLRSAMHQVADFSKISG